MNILVCNDDGYNAEGIKLLKRHLEKYGNVYLIGPKHHQSGASHSINIHGPLEFDKFGPNEYYVDSSPADCVRVSKLLNKKIDLVVSGVNDGLNLGTDVIYSGTISGAREAVIEDIPGIAISTDFGAFQIVEDELDMVLDFIFVNKLYSNEYVLNVNFPTEKHKKSKGIKIARQGVKIFDTHYKLVDGKAHVEYDIYKTSEEDDTDVYLANEGYITIVPLGLDSTLMPKYKELKEKYDK